MHVLLSKVLSQLSLIVFDDFISQFDTTTIVFRDCLGFLCCAVLLFALRKAMEILDQRCSCSVSNRRSGQFTSKERVASTPSTAAVPSNPVKWAVDG